MRTYGRQQDPVTGALTWIEVATSPEAGDDYVWLTTLAQTLKLNLTESPFFGDWGIPAKPAVIQQVFPDFYVTRTQQRYAPRFASLIVAKVPDVKPNYRINVTLNNGVPIEPFEVAT